MGGAQEALERGHFHRRAASKDLYDRNVATGSGVAVVCLGGVLAPTTLTLLARYLDLPYAKAGLAIT